MKDEVRIVCRQCGSTHSLGKHGLTLYFNTAKDRDDFVNMAAKELTFATAYPIFAGTKGPTDG